MVKLTEEQRHFVVEEITSGKLATVRGDGRRDVVAIWYDVDGDTIVFNAGNTSVKAANMRRDPRVMLCIDDVRLPFAFILIEGTATLSDDLETVKHWATRIGGRYMGEDLAEAYGKRNGVEGELLVRVTPTKVRFEKDVAS